jgi:CRISPR-associated protein Cmr6
MPREFNVPEADSHAGLCYGAAAPVSLADGRVQDGIKGKWLDAIASIRIPEGYAAWFKHHWRKTMEQDCFVLECVAASRLLVGSGNASGFDVGLHLHHTWGVPMVPGSAIKGVLSHYLDAVYGPDPEHDGISPVSPQHPDPDRARFRRPGRKPATPPGNWQRIICGSADYSGVSMDLPAAAGYVIFHDMLFIPPEDRDHRMAMLAPDVLTPHHGEYYGKGGVANDYEDPTPVPFLSVPPGTRFLLAVGGQRAWAEFAIGRLADAIAEWGLGAKTAAGYGRFECIGAIAGPRKPPLASAVARTLKTKIEAWLAEHKPAQGSLAQWEQFVTRFCQTFQQPLQALNDDPEKKNLVQLVRSLVAGTTLSRTQKMPLRQKLDAI